MNIYKALQPVSVLSFDLDNTLYDNAPVLEAAEQAMLTKLAELLPSVSTDAEFWWQQRKQLARQQPDIRHDVSQWRIAGLESGLQQLGVATDEIPRIAQQAFTAFINTRRNISLTPQTLRMLEQLARHFTLIAITNGNAILEPMGLDQLFRLYLCAGPDGRMKPYPDLFHNAANQLQVLPQQMLHIGDSHRADVMGALNAGCQAAWLDHHNTPVNVLPHIRLQNLEQLHSLL
ncbi:HAD-IA family hydrolase [Chromatiaceae bacterium AAb-1]|nr:HAD-IA family hydrolase [Chromatiaceae bacterium AAb-1]